MTKEFLYHHICQEQRMEQMVWDLQSSCAEIRQMFVGDIQGKTGDALDQKMRQIEAELQKLGMDIHAAGNLLYDIPATEF